MDTRNQTQNKQWYKVVSSILFAKFMVHISQLHPSNDHFKSWIICYMQLHKYAENCHTDIWLNLNPNDLVTWQKN